MSGIYELYEDVKGRVDEFKSSLYEMHQVFISNGEYNHPVIYVATADKKQYWFFKVEESTLLEDAQGPYAVSVKGRGVRAYLNAPVDPNDILSNTTYLMGNNKPDSYGAMIHSCFGTTLIRYEVFGNFLASVTPSKISISDIIRNATSVDLDDYLIGIIPYPNFVGNFAKYASYLLGTTEMTPNI